MSAKPNDVLRIQELYDVATQTLAQFEDLGFTEGRFLNPANAQDDLIADGLVNRVLRVTEEGGKLSEEFVEYGFEMREMSALRNRIAHAYGTIDRSIVWQVLVEEFPALVKCCERYCEDQGLYLLETWRGEEADSGRDEA